jgi:putative membrane protein
MVERILLFLKGVCMGSADIIPGVSGGTMALILGIYKKLVDSIKSVNLRWVAPLWRWVTGGRDPEDWREVQQAIEPMNLGFLTVLGLGIVTALGVGSVVIPGLMEQYPVLMRAFFFGLILASTWVPLRMIRGTKERFLGGALAVAVVGMLAGWLVTNPSRSMNLTQTPATVTSEGENLEDLVRRAPSAELAVSVYWREANGPLRESIRAASPDVAQRLADLHEEFGGGEGAVDKEALKKRSEPYRTVVVPAGTPVEVPRPAPWFVFVAGSVAICAMILPGISGSYILLILGMYFFVLNAIKGSIQSLVGGAVPLEQLGFVGLFGVGAAVGLLSFARFLSYLLARYPAQTLAGLIGLMLGCLRGIWPFRTSVDGMTTNVWPASFDSAVFGALAACLIGGMVVAALTVFGRRMRAMDDAEAGGH